jgi:hypothetical protein
MELAPPAFILFLHVSMSAPTLQQNYRKLFHIYIYIYIPSFDVFCFLGCVPEDSFILPQTARFKAQNFKERHGSSPEASGHAGSPLVPKRKKTSDTWKK